MLITGDVKFWIERQHSNQINLPSLSGSNSFLIPLVLLEGPDNTNLIIFTQMLFANEATQIGLQVDSTFLDFAEAFDFNEHLIMGHNNIRFSRY